MGDEQVYIVDECLSRQFILMEVMHEIRSSGGPKFPRIPYFSLYFKFWYGFFFPPKKLQGKYLTILSPMNGNNVTSLSLFFSFLKLPRKLNFKGEIMFTEPCFSFSSHLLFLPPTTVQLLERWRGVNLLVTGDNWVCISLLTSEATF